MKKNELSHYTLDLVHIDVARNATDDFNLFHDKQHWHEIVDNPYKGPIALGFQLTCYIEHYFRQYRSEHQEQHLIQQHGLDYSNYQLNFATAVSPGDNLTLDVKSSRLKHNGQARLGNRFVLKNQNGIVLIGFKSETQLAEFGLAQLPFNLPQLAKENDRTVLTDGSYFYKRKYTTNSNAKNFLTASAVEQSLYFDELENKVRFPESYCTALISCALLEQANSLQHDFRRQPMVYTSHRLSVHKQRVMDLRSDQMLHLLVSPGQQQANTMVLHQCFGLNHKQEILFQGEIELAPLSQILH